MNPSRDCPFPVLGVIVDAIGIFEHSESDSQ